MYCKYCGSPIYKRLIDEKIIDQSVCENPSTQDRYLYVTLIQSGLCSFCTRRTEKQELIKISDKGMLYLIHQLKEKHSNE